MDSLSTSSWEASSGITFQPGDVLGKHLVMGKLLGRGGTARVYEARDTRLSTEVAVKVVDSQSGTGEGRARLRREAQICMDIDDPRLPRVHSLGELPCGAVYMVMEKVPGKTLDLWVHQGAMDIERACRIVSELLSVLHNVHAHGYVHRDVKPSNVILEPLADGSERVRLIDFGVSKVATVTRDATAITAMGEIVGTPAYMAPEQLTGKPVDGRVDVHAAGIVLYELLSGTPLYAGSSFGEIVASVLRDELPNIRTVRPLVPQSVADIIATATSKEPDLRFDCALSMKAALDEVIEGLRQETCVGMTLLGGGREHAKTAHRLERGTTSGVHSRTQHRAVRRVALADQDEESALGCDGTAVPHVA